MQYESLYRPSAAEFPHDNPRVDRGALWIGSPLCLLAAPTETDPDATVSDTATTTAPDLAVTLAPAPATDVPSDDPIATFVRAVTDVALTYGPVETAAHIEALFQSGAFLPESLSPPAQAALFEGNIIETTDEGIRPTESFASARDAWEGILRGAAGDLSACGDSTLDAWTADLVARLIANPAKAPTIRRDLRRRGIAAFGMLS